MADAVVAPSLLYTSHRYANNALRQLTYQFTLPDGVYLLRLHFAELFHDSAGDRVFDIRLNGNSVIASSYDVLEAAGRMDAAVTVSAIVATSVIGNVVTIDFLRERRRPMVSGIEFRVVGAETTSSAMTTESSASTILTTSSVLTTTTTSSTMFR